MTGSVPKSVHGSVMTKSDLVRFVEDIRMMLLHNIPNRTTNVCVQRLNDDQRGMSRLEDHIPTIPCGATICMSDAENRTSCYVFDHISGTEGGFDPTSLLLIYFCPTILLSTLILLPLLAVYVGSICSIVSNSGGNPEN